MTQAHLVGISGSLRSASYNTALLRSAFENLPDGVTASIASLKGIPLFDQDDVTEHGKPQLVEDLRSAVAAADGIVFATPEYNWSVTGAMKNAIDWLSGGPDSPLDFKPAAIAGVGGGSGTARSQVHLRDILGHNSLCILADLAEFLEPRPQQPRDVVGPCVIRLRREVDGALAVASEHS